MPGATWWSWGATTATCCRTSWRRAFPRSGSSRPPTWPPPRVRRACPPSSYCSGRRLAAREAAAGLQDLARYAQFTEQVHETKRRLVEFLIGVKRQGKSVAGYGAPGKGNTLLNYCGIRTDFLDYT